MTNTLHRVTMKQV